MNWKTNYLNKSWLPLRLISQVWSTDFLKASSRQVPWDFPLYNGHVGTKNPLFKKQMIYFNVYVAATSI